MQKLKRDVLVLFCFPFSLWKLPYQGTEKQKQFCPFQAMLIQHAKPKLNSLASSPHLFFATKVFSSSLLFGDSGGLEHREVL